MPAIAVRTNLGSQDTWIKRFVLVTTSTGPAILDLHKGTKHTVDTDAVRKCKSMNDEFDAPVRKVIDDALEEEFNGYVHPSDARIAKWSFRPSINGAFSASNSDGTFVIKLSNKEAAMMAEAYVSTRILQQQLRMRAMEG